MSELAIARWLNLRKIPWIGTKPWTYGCVRTILTNPKYSSKPLRATFRRCSSCRSRT